MKPIGFLSLFALSNILVATASRVEWITARGKCLAPDDTLPDSGVTSISATDADSCLAACQADSAATGCEVVYTYHNPADGTLPGSEFGDQHQGSMETPYFEIQADKLHFLVGGGNHWETRVELMDEDGNRLFHASGKNNESMHRVYWDLRPHKGKKALIRIVDHRTGHWAHINADDFVFEPPFATDPGFTLDFEDGTIDGWTLTGDAFTTQPTLGDNPTARDRGQPSMHEGNFWIGGWENYKGTATVSGCKKYTSRVIDGDGTQTHFCTSKFTFDDVESYTIDATDKWGRQKGKCRNSGGGEITTGMVSLPVDSAQACIDACAANPLATGCEIKWNYVPLPGYVRNQGHGDWAKGTMTSGTFVVPEGTLSFLVGGGYHENTIVELIKEDGTQLRKAKGRGDESMGWVTWDLSDIVGTTVQIRVVDEHTGGWGHVNLDDFTFDPPFDPGFTLDFEEGDLRGWVTSGTTFLNQPTLGDNPTARNRGQPSFHHGNYWIGGWEKFRGAAEFEACHMHTEPVSFGFGYKDDDHTCWMKPLKSVCSAKDAADTFSPMLKGYCRRPDGGDQNAGVIKLQSGDFFHPEQKQLCLEMCACHPGATGCEVIWDRGNRGCYVHTAEVSQAHGEELHNCWVGKNQPFCNGPTGRVWGDPHVDSFDGNFYDCQGAGEHVIVNTFDGPLRIHGVFETGTWRAGLTVGKTVAFEVDPDIPMIQGVLPKYNHNGCGYTFLVGEDKTPVADITTHFNDPDKIRVYQYRNTFTFFYPRYSSRVVLALHNSNYFGCEMGVSVCLTAEKFGGWQNIGGILGTPNGDPADEWVTKDKTILPTPIKKHWRQRIQQSTDWCKANWCVGRYEDSMFDETTFYEYNQCAIPYDAGPAIKIIEDAGPDVAESCETDPNFCTDLAGGGPEAADESKKFEETLKKVETLEPKVLEDGPDAPDAPEIPLLDEEPECTMNRSNLFNPTCPDRPIVEFIPIEGSSSAPPTDLLYDFEFDPSGLNVTFKVWHEAGQMDEDDVDVYVQHFDVPEDDAPIGNWVCSKHASKCISDGPPKKVQAMCHRRNKEAVITVSYVLKGANDAGTISTPGEISECCHADTATHPVLHFTFAIKCGCPEATPERALRGISN